MNMLISILQLKTNAYETENEQPI